MLYSEYRKQKKKILREAQGGRKNHFNYREKRIRIMVNVSSEIMQVRSKWNKIFEVLEEK